MSDPGDSRRLSDRRTDFEPLALAIVAAIYVVHAWRFWFLSDDAFISFRYARNWFEGLGLRYNATELPPVEGYSNFLWIVVCASIEAAGGDPTFWAPAVSIGCGVLLLVSVHRAIRLRLGLPRIAALGASLALALFPPFAAWGTGGLETMPFALALFLLFDRVVLREDAAPVSDALLGIAASLLRTEGIFWAVLVGALGFVWRRNERRRLALYFGLLLLGFTLYFIARYAYYQALFPNPVYLKVGFGSDVLVRGLRYAALFFLTFLSPFLIFPAAAAALRRTSACTSPGIAVVILALAFPAYAVVVGGDWMVMGRFLIPGLAFQAMLVAWLLHHLASRGRAARALVPAAILVGMLPAWNIHLVPEAVRKEFRYMYSHPGFQSEVETWQTHREEVDYWTEVGLALRDYAQPGDSLVVGAIGAIGYYSNLHIYDRFGLVSPDVVQWARTEEARGPLRSPGHDVKVSRDHFLDDEPTLLLFDVIDSDRMRSRVLEQAEEWRELGTLWRRYAPDFIVLDGKDVSETHRVLVVLRAIEDDSAQDVTEMKRRERRRVRAERANEVWSDFYRRAEELPDAS